MEFSPEWRSAKPKTIGSGPWTVKIDWCACSPELVQGSRNGRRPGKVLTSELPLPADYDAAFTRRKRNRDPRKKTLLFIRFFPIDADGRVDRANIHKNVLALGTLPEVPRCQL